MKRFGILIKSDRAIEAESCGKVTYSALKAWQKRAVDCARVLPCEWHHTSAAANRTNYYRPEDFEDLDPKDFPPRGKEGINQADLSRLKIVITYNKMISGFSSRNKKFETITVEGLDVRKKDGKITGANGRRLSSNNISVVYMYKPYRARTWREILRSEAEEAGYVFA